MEDWAKHILTPLKSIEPDAEFISRSKHLILSMPQEMRGLKALKVRLFEGMRFGVALTLASVLIIVALGSLSYLHTLPSPAAAGALDSTTLTQEADSASKNFMLQLDEASYFNDSAAKASAILDELSKKEQ